MITFNPYILLFIILVLFIVYQIWQYKKQLHEYKEAERTTEQAMQKQVKRKDTQGIEWQLKRQHHANAWAREELNKHVFDREDTRSTKRKWLEFIVFGIIPIICLIVALNYPKYAKKRALELAQEPSNLIHGCMYFEGYGKLKPSPAFSIQNKVYQGFHIQVEETPAYQKFKTYRFEKNHCYQIKYVKIITPIFTEKIYVYDIDL